MILQASSLFRSSVTNSVFPRVRFAPSPSGYIHIGNLRIALSNWLFTLQHEGQFFLRYDDTDTERTNDIYVRAIYEDLTWVGIVVHKTFYQSHRFWLYDRAVEQLKKNGFLYPCYESEQELSSRRREQLSQKLPPIYGREALKKTTKDRKKFELEGRKPHWRFLLPNFEENVFKLVRSPVYWNDLVRGEQSIDLSSVSDPILVRENGSYLYTLSSVIDDFEMGISHVIRGSDHITNTGIQIAIFRALNAKIPVFAHVNLLTTKFGGGFSKRNSSMSVRQLREEGVLPGAIASLAVLTGTCKNIVPCRTLEDLAKHFKLSSFSKSPAKFDHTDLFALNRQLFRLLSVNDVLTLIKQQKKEDREKFDFNFLTPVVQKLSDLIAKETGQISAAFKEQHNDFSESIIPAAAIVVVERTNFIRRWKEKIKAFRCLKTVAQDPKLLSMEQKNVDNFWKVLKNNFESLDDVLQWWKIIFDPQIDFYTLCIKEYIFLQQTVEFLPEEPWSHNTWKEWINCLKNKTKRTNKSLFQPLRLALTGKKSGPELAELLLLMGKIIVISRLLCIRSRLESVSN